MNGKDIVIVIEDARLRHERGNLSGRQDGSTVDERQMDADTKCRRPLCKQNRIVKRRAARHQRRRAQHAVLYAALHRAVDEHMPPKIVRIDNDPLQNSLHRRFLLRVSAKLPFIIPQSAAPVHPSRRFHAQERIRGHFYAHAIYIRSTEHRHVFAGSLSLRTFTIVTKLRCRR